MKIRGEGGEPFRHPPTRLPFLLWDKRRKVDAVDVRQDSLNVVAKTPNENPQL